MLIQQAENKVLHLNQWLYGGEIVLLVFMLFVISGIVSRETAGTAHTESDKFPQKPSGSLLLHSFKQSFHTVFNSLWKTKFHAVSGC